MRSQLQTAPRRRGIIIAGALLMTTTSSLAYAQTPPNPSGGSTVEDVVVTAQRRSQAVSKIPASITAISNLTIQKFGIENFSDFAKLAPNLSYGYSVGGPSGVTSSRAISIRGISGSNTTSFYIDDTPLPQTVDPRIFNLDHIEVLRGPQGTLFGASSMGGTVRMITRAPTGDQVTGNIDVQGGVINHAPGAMWEVSGVVNFPIIKDVISGQVAGFENNTPGWFKRTWDDPQALNLGSAPVTGPAKVANNIGDVAQQGLSATLHITPPALPGLTLTPLVMYQNSSSNGFPLADYSQDNLTQRRVLNVPESWRDTFFFSALTASYQLPFGRIVSSTSYFNRRTFNLEDGTDGNTAAFSPGFLTPVMAPNYGFDTSFTQEARFESSVPGPLQFVLGTFYQNEDTNYHEVINAPGLNAATGGVFGTDNVFSPIGASEISQFAGFLGLTLHLGNLELQAGGRESILKSNVTSVATGIFGTDGVQSTPSKATPFTPRFSAKYNFTPNTMVYATVAQGFRIGGSNAPAPAACAGLISPIGTDIPYTSDTLWSYEGGVKSAALDNRLSVSADVYHIDWTRIQQTKITVQNACFAELILNLGSAVSNGAEFESSFRATDDLTLHVAAGYEDAHLTLADAGTGFHVGQALSGIPKWTVSGSADYSIPQPWGYYFLRGEYTFTGQSFSYTEAESGLIRKAYTLIDLRAGGVIHKHYTAAIFVKNLLDSRDNLSDEAPETSIAPGRYRYFVGQPRTVGVDLKYNF